MPGAISLGLHVITNSKDTKTLDHEYGHTVQSERWGPLYLPVIGVKSLLEVWFDNDGYYYDDWPENEADKLGGVIR
jgi:hypothetical protein